MNKIPGDVAVDGGALGEGVDGFLGRGFLRF